MAEDAQAIRVLWQRVPVVAFVNNHFAGYARRRSSSSWRWHSRISTPAGKSSATVTWAAAMLPPWLAPWGGKALRG